jgi:transglutaminase-like putative cysteine protease
MVRMSLQIDLKYLVESNQADFILNVHAAHTSNQRVVSERLTLQPLLRSQLHTDPATQNRFLRLQAPAGPLSLRYEATVDIQHHIARVEQVPEVPVCALPSEVLCYLYPSRYCPSDELAKVANQAFGHLWQGLGRVLAIQQWVQANVAYVSNTSDGHTSALDTLRLGQGVCRDFAHVMIALCRALNMPARFVTGTDYGADPCLGPPDFHAYVEVWLGQRWYLFDPSGTTIPMGLVRFGTGRDAADVAFATIFGDVRTQSPVIHTEALQDVAGAWERPLRGPLALSTDDGSKLRWPG